MRPHARHSLLTALLALACASPLLDEPADLVFLGDHILTVDESTRGATAVAVRDDTIVAVGSRSDSAGWIGDETRVIELGERALVPGFIDTHGHLALVTAEIDFVNVSSPPVGPVRSIDDIVTLLRARIAERSVPAGEWVVGFGYDDSLLEEGRHPNRDDLDRVSTDHPIALLHVSHHLGAANSAALASVGYDANSEDPEGGVIRRRPGTTEPDGVLEETAGMGLFFTLMAQRAQTSFAPDLLRSIDYHAAMGITTIQDGASSPEFIAGVRAVAANAPLAVDVAAFPSLNGRSGPVDPASIGYSRDYENGFRIAGVKFVLDGSPQGRTAWLTQPYTEGPPGVAADYVAYPILDPAFYLENADAMIDAGIPILVHANGDAAIDLMIEGVAEAIGDERPDHRSVTIHAQLTREDQIDAMKEYGIVPSYFSAHTFFWGDWHRRSFGEERASGISPTKSTLERGVPFTIHNDAPVVPPDVLRLIEITVNRTTRSGTELGPDERLSFEEALHAVTLGAAYAYFEEDTKGSITPGKRADLVVLARDPRDVASDEIAEVAIVETIARGRTVYSRAE